MASSLSANQSSMPTAQAFRPPLRQDLRPPNYRHAGRPQNQMIPPRPRRPATSSARLARRHDDDGGAADGAISTRSRSPMAATRMFASRISPYETLSDGNEEDAVRPKAGTRSRWWRGGRQPQRPFARPRCAPDDSWRETVNLHPVVRTHPETGRKLLQRQQGLYGRFEGMTERGIEAAARLPAGRRGNKPEFHLPAFRWKRGSVAFWDTARSKHSGDPHRRPGICG